MCLLYVHQVNMVTTSLAQIPVGCCLMTSRSSMVNQRSNNMNTKLRIDNFMLILLLAFMPVAVFAQYNQYPQGSYEGAQTYSDMISGKQPKAVKHNKVREQYEENLKRRHIQRVDRSELKATFIPKGMWMCGTTVNFREWENENQNLLVLKNLNMMNLRIVDGN